MVWPRSCWNVFVWMQRQMVLILQRLMSTRSSLETDHEFRGPLTMYEKCGFSRYGEREGRVVMRKALK